MPKTNLQVSDTPEQKIPDNLNDNSQSEVIIRFLWFLIHIKNPNPHTIEIVKRVLKFCELLLVLAFVYALVKIFLLLAH